MKHTKKQEITLRRPAIMVDIETLDTSVTAAIVSIAAIVFDVHGQSTREDLLKDHFYTNISIVSNQKFGRTMSADTIEWWFKQSQEAQRALYSDPILPFNTALIKYRQWLEAQTADRIYACDPDFDCNILAHGLESIKDRDPFQYHGRRSVRTTIEFAYPDEPMPNVEMGTAHNALDDVVKQALQMQHCWNKIHG